MPEPFSWDHEIVVLKREVAEMRRAAAGKRRDAVEPAIVDALRAVGAIVDRVNGLGLPDLLVRFRGRLWAFEVKSATGRQTIAQQQTDWPIVRTPAEALHQIGAE